MWQTVLRDCEVVGFLDWEGWEISNTINTILKSFNMVLICRKQLNTSPGSKKKNGTGT